MVEENNVIELVDKTQSKKNVNKEVKSNGKVSKLKLEFKAYRQVIVISSFFVLLILIVSAIMLLNKAYFGIESGYINIVMTIIVGLLTSILASMLIKSYVESTNEHEYNYASSLYDNKMADHHLSTLAKSEGQYFTDYNIELDFAEEDEAFLRVHRKYRYTKVLTSNIIKFRFISILEDEDMMSDEYQNIVKNNTSTSYEFYQNNDYRAVLRKYNVESPVVKKLERNLKDKIIKNVRVFSHNEEITSKLKPINCKNNGRIYEIDLEIPKNIFRMNKEFIFRYELDYLIEYESYSEIPIKLPIRKFDYTVTWSSLVNTHDFDVYRTLSTQTGLEENYISLEGRIEDTILDIYPNSSFCIIWWAKK